MIVNRGVIMNFLSVAAVAKLWSMSERSVRNYCAEGRIPGAILVGKTWMIPSDAAKPNRKARTSNSTKTVKYKSKSFSSQCCLTHHKQEQVGGEHFILFNGRIIRI